MVEKEKDRNKYSGLRFKYGIDLVISYWIFAWYLLYIAGFPVGNPKLALMVALIMSCVSLLYMIYNHSPFIRIILYILVQVCIKVVPLYTLRKQKIYLLRDILTLGIVSMIYVAWLYINNTSLQDVYITRRLTPTTDILIDYIPALKYR
jgi:hypothetical protein